MAEELHFSLGQGTLLWVQNEAVLPKALKNCPQVLKMFFDCSGEDEDIVDVHRAEGQVPQDHIHRPLEGGPSVAEPEAGEVEREGTEGRRHGGLRYIFRGHRNLIIALGEVQLGEDLGAVQVGCHVRNVGQRVVVAFCDVVEASVVAAGPVGTVLLGDHVEGGGPGACGFLANALGLQLSEDLLGCFELRWGQAAELGVDWGALRHDVVLDTMGLLGETGQRLAENISELGGYGIKGVCGDG